MTAIQPDNCFYLLDFVGADSIITAYSAENYVAQFKKAYNRDIQIRSCRQLTSQEIERLGLKVYSFE